MYLGSRRKTVTGIASAHYSFRGAFDPHRAASDRRSGRARANRRNYIQRASEFFDKQGFFEREASRQVERFGNIAHIFSTYESRHAKDDPKPFQRGINSIQLMYDGKRWWW